MTSHFATTDPIIKVSELKLTFDVSDAWLTRVVSGRKKQFLRAVDGISFEVNRGETFAIVGESGSGKSTVARMVLGLIQPTEGQVAVDGVPITTRRKDAGMQSLRHRIQMIFQDPYASLNPRWRIDKIVAEPIRKFKTDLSEQQVSDRVGELLSLVGLHPEFGIKYPHQFSGGQRQRVAIARALASEPDLIVCDEPTSALDVSVQAQILNLMRDLQERLGLTYLLISHDLAVVRHMSDQVGVMYLGRLVEVRPTREIFADPRHPYTQMLLDAVPDLTMDVPRKTIIAGEVPSPINPPSGCTYHPRCPLAANLCRKVAPLLINNVACHADAGKLATDD